MTAAVASAIFEGEVRHRRHAPRPHAFRYRTTMLYIDLAEVETLFARRWLWSSRRAAPARFERADYLGPADTPLADAVRDRVEAETGRRPAGAIRLLTHLRYFGFVFNPVSFYYCHDAAGALECIVAEITNTPWKERHAYVLPVATARRDGDALCWDFPKTFHVSPFMAMRREYRWRLGVPGERLQVHMDVLDGAAREFDATLSLRRRPLDGPGLARVLWRFPLMTVQVVAAIHWQALRLWLKRIPVHDHPTLRGSA
jgi:DUF1365 family protein